MHTSSSYAKILGETNFHTHVDQKQKTEKKRGKKERAKVGNIITIASYELQCHLVWHTQSRLGQQLQFSTFFKTKFYNAFEPIFGLWRKQLTVI